MQFYEEPSFLMLVMLIPGYALVCFCLFKYLHKQQCTQIQSIAQAFQQPSVHTTDPMYQPIIQAHHHSLKQTEHELADVKKELQNQREHYENLAHQIKAVLTTTMLHADMLMEETNEQHHLPAILVQMEKANDLLDVYLQGKDVKSNLFPYHYTYAPLQLALEHAIARTQAYAKTKDIQFSLTADASIVFAYDSFWMEEAIETILRNGITYANASSCIEVVLSASDGHIVLDLRDTGMCMRKDDIQKAFVRYAHSDHKEHYGIGLAMAKQIIEQHFGTITILPFAHGVTFHIVFPQMDLEETA